MLQGELSPELRDRQLELLERRYQGARLPVHRAAAIIQTAWREHVLRTKFRRMVELAKSGPITQRLLSVENILQTIPKKIPLRDLRLLLRKPSSNVKKMPALLPRPSSNCYILDIEHIRILCYSDKVNKIITTVCRTIPA